MKFNARRGACAALFLGAGCAAFSAAGREASAARPAKKAPAKKAPAGKPAATASMPSATGRVTYSFQVAPMSGTSTITWIEGGKKFRQDMKLSGNAPGAPAGAAPTQVEMWMIGDGTYIYSHQPMMGKQVYRMKMPKASPGAAGPAGLPVGGAQEGKLIGKGTILGKPCEIRQLQGAKVWSWKGLALKMENTGGAGPAMTMTATKLEMPYKASPTLFKVPAGYTVTEQMPGIGAAPGGAAPPIRKGKQ